MVASALRLVSPLVMSITARYEPFGICLLRTNLNRLRLTRGEKLDRPSPDVIESSS